MNLSSILSKPQQYSVIKILLEIMEADGVIHPREINFINKVLKDFQISENELETINSFEVQYSISLLQNLNEDVKTEINQLFTDMAKCDGYADPRELKIIESLGK